MIVVLVVLAFVAFAGYVVGYRIGRRCCLARAAPPTAGHVVEVFSRGGLVLWQSVASRGTADSVVERWSLPGYAVVRYGPGDRAKDVVYGGDELEAWESVWPIDRPEALRRAR